MKKVSKYLIILGSIFITLAISLVVRNMIMEKVAFERAISVLKEIEGNDDNIVTINDGDMPSVNILDNDYIGIIEIPSLNLKLPVMKDASYEKLDTSPGRYYGSVYTDDLVICAHDYARHFGYIESLKQDDIVIFRDMNNTEYVYKVEVIEVLNPTDVKEMIESEFDLTLYTCTYDGLRRVTVRCNRVKDNI